MLTPRALLVCSIILSASTAQAELAGTYSGFDHGVADDTLVIRSDGRFDRAGVTGRWKLDKELLVLEHPGSAQGAALRWVFETKDDVLVERSDPTTWYANNQDRDGSFTPRRLLKGKKFSGALGLGKVAFTLPKGWKAVFADGGYDVRAARASIRLELRRHAGGTLGDLVRRTRVEFYPEPALRDLRAAPETYLRPGGRVGYLFIDTTETTTQAIAVVWQGDWGYVFATSYEKEDASQTAVAFETLVHTLVATPPVSNTKLTKAIAGCWVTNATTGNFATARSYIATTRNFLTGGRYTVNVSGTLTPAPGSSYPGSTFSNNSSGSYLVIGDKILQTDDEDGQQLAYSIKLGDKAILFGGSWYFPC